MLELLNDEGQERIFEQLYFFTSRNEYLKDKYKTKTDNAQVVNFENKRPKGF